MIEGKKGKKRSGKEVATFLFLIKEKQREEKEVADRQSPQYYVSQCRHGKGEGKKKKKEVNRRGKKKIPHLISPTQKKKKKKKKVSLGERKGKGKTE